MRYRRGFFPLYSPKGTPSPQKYTTLYVRPLRNSIVLRPGTSDGEVLWETFHGLYHLPPPLGHEPSVIWDLGANVGLTTAHFASLFAAAKVIGVELDRETATLASRNVAPWSDRCKIVHAAVWPKGGEVAYAKLLGQEYGAKVTNDAEGVLRAPAISLNTLLARSAADQVDFLKMDIEGAECVVLRECTAWARSVRSIVVEVHDPYTIEECVADLREIGFSAEADDRHWACVRGERSL